MSKAPAGHYCRRPRGPHAGRGRPHVRRLQGLGVEACRPLPRRGRIRLRSTLASTEELPHSDACRSRRPHRRAAHGARERRSRRGPDTIAWHLDERYGLRVSPTTISRHLTRCGLVIAQPRKRPRSSYVRFEADQPNECWQADFTHYRLADGTDSEILTFSDDHSRLALSIGAHRAVTGTGLRRRR